MIRSNKFSSNWSALLCILPSLSFGIPQLSTEYRDRFRPNTLLGKKQVMKIVALVFYLIDYDTFINVIGNI